MRTAMTGKKSREKLQSTIPLTNVGAAANHGKVFQQPKLVGSALAGSVGKLSAIGECWESSSLGAEIQSVGAKSCGKLGLI
jgi:hypothetical protein